MKNNSNRCKPLLCALLSVLLCGAAGAARHDPEVTLREGKVRGLAGAGFVAFLGMPYAAPPLGDLRWRAPQPMAHWTATWDASRFRADCSQDPFPHDAAPSTAPFDENCLYVNVWKPAAAARPLPVMVWIYGGGFVNGGTSPAVYDGSAFAKNGVVLVSFNYRVGNFGFFAHPALSAEQPSEVLANYGLMDQIAALKWVREHIAAFGGDPGNVTVFGESAGGMSIHYLMSSPLAGGLFHKAIIESGGGRSGPFGSRPLSGAADSAEAQGVKLARQFGIEGNDAAALRQLRALPAASLSQGLHMGTMSTYGAYVGGPVLDGKLIVGDPATLYQQGVGPRIPVMIGATDADLGFAPGTTVAELFAPFEAKAGHARAVFDPTGQSELRQLSSAIGASQVMLEPARHVARLLSARGQSVFEFRFSYVAEALRPTVGGAYHASEIPYVFDSVNAALGSRADVGDLEVGKYVQAYWVAFAKSGVPRVVGKPAWPVYVADGDELMNFTNVGPIAEVDPWQARLDLAAGLSDERTHAR